ncbi:sensor histidine kinase [Jidongwangia harbinensis]|uniref:sensor histidine kinase n=1 Tax=Jidongwangia harbinensis TaxID=2878561 RepID=UPI001CD9F00E|nr:sensor histidine kinase [Jidongwangia harbinensis]MCA2211672.1 PAS domain S-box protein [Jidongwangia harbinensis]
MRFLRPGGLRFVALPLLVWLLLTMSGTAGLWWLERSSRDALAQRFQLRVGLASDFVTTYVADLIARERVQAEAFLTDPVVQERDFARSVSGFGYPAAVLLDSAGRALHVTPTDPAVIGRDLTLRYAHLRTAVVEGEPAVSVVVPSAARGVPVVAFAVPFETASGRRVFSGAVEIRDSPLASYLTTAISLPGVRLRVVDTSGAIVAANHTHQATVPTLNTDDHALANALRQQPKGRYQDDGRWWRYASYTIAGTPWQLSATVTEEALFASIADNEIAGRAALGAATAVGLLVVAAAGRAARNRRELQVSEERFRKVFDSSRIGMALNDPDGRFVRVNPALCQILGYPESELRGTHFDRFTDPADLAVCLDRLQDCLAGRIDGFDLDKRYRHADGHPVEASVTTVLIDDDQGRPQHFATQIIDVTERRALERARTRHEAELADRAERLQRANTQMTDFIAMLTHDVRQPLANIVSGGELLLGDWADIDDHAKHHYVQRMTTSGYRADAIVTEILTLAQLDAGAITVRPSRLDVREAVRQAVTAPGIGTDHTVTVTAPDEARGFADAAHLQLILANLLGNAVKYGRPPVDVTVERGRGAIHVRVSDHGEGVPAEFVPHLFDRFTRAATGVATTKPGTGLGLYFVRQLAHASGITIDYQPTEPRGATFVLTIPTTPPPGAAAPHRMLTRGSAATPS